MNETGMIMSTQISLADSLCSFRRITTGWRGFYTATSQGSTLVMLALVLRLVAITMFVYCILHC